MILMAFFSALPIFESFQYVFFTWSTTPLVTLLWTKKSWEKKSQRRAAAFILMRRSLCSALDKKQQRSSAEEEQQQRMLQKFCLSLRLIDFCLICLDLSDFMLRYFHLTWVAAESRNQMRLREREQSLPNSKGHRLEKLIIAWIKLCSCSKSGFLGGF